MGDKQIYAKHLNAEHVGTIASFEDDWGVIHRGEIRQIHHNGTHTYLFLIDAEYDRNHNYAFPEFELEHETLIMLECEHD